MAKNANKYFDIDSLDRGDNEFIFNERGAGVKAHIKARLDSLYSTLQQERNEADQDLIDDIKELERLLENYENETAN